MKSSLAWDANKRVEEYRNSVKSVQENVLLFKGFLGPSLKDKPELSSVGARAARAAGVIVDELGKLRCPPGTPNANQFTDMQMSNCMVPGMAVARRAVRAGRREVGQMLENAKRVLDGKPVSSVTKVAALASLATLDALDYINVDGSGTLSAVTLLGTDMLRSVGRDFAELALNRLERQGKISKEQRRDIDGIVNRISELGSSKYTAALLSGIRRPNRTRKLRSETPDMDMANASPPDISNRGDGLAKVTFDADSFNTELEAKVTKLLDMYVPDRGSKDFEEYGDELILKMGIPPSRSAKEMVDDAIDYLEKEGESRVALLRADLEGLGQQKAARRKELADQLEKIIRSLETEGGRAEVRKEIGRGFAESLVGAELMMRDNPSLRGQFSFEIHKQSDRGLSDAAAYAWMPVYPDGRIIPAVRFKAEGLLLNNDQLSDAIGESGDMVSGSVRLIGADDNQVGLGIHEVSHIAHYAELLKTIGIDPTASAKPALDQIVSHGSKVGDTYIGARFAIDHGIDIDSEWADVVKAWDDEKLRKLSYGYVSSDTPTIKNYFAKYVTSTIHRESAETDSALSEYSRLVDVRRTSTFRKQDSLFDKALVAVRMDSTELQGFDTDNNEDLKTVDGIRAMVEQALDGQTIEDFLEEGRRAFSGVLGFDPLKLQTKGIDRAEVIETLGSASEYAQTNAWESFAEAKTLVMLTKHFPDSKIFDDESFDKIRGMVDAIAPDDSGMPSPAMMTEDAKSWSRKLRSAIERMPDIPERPVEF